jgi:PAS domain S-box-containing protein
MKQLDCSSMKTPSGSLIELISRWLFQMQFLREMNLTLFNPPASRNLSNVLLSYILSIVLPVMAMLLSVTFFPIIQQTRLLFFIIAIVLNAYHGGFGPGILSALISIVLAILFVFEPSFILLNSDGLLLLSIFAFFATFISWREETRLQTELALRDAKNQLEIIFNGVVDGITAQSADGRMAFANEAAARLNGYASVKALLEASPEANQGSYELFDDLGNIISRAQLPENRALAEGVSSELAYRKRKIDTGEERWLSVKSAPVLDDNGKARMAITIVRDISDAKKAEAERVRLLLLIEQQRQRMQNILNNVPGTVWEAIGQPSSDNGQQNTFVSNYAPRMLGYSVQEWLETPKFWEKLVHPEDWETAAAQAAEIYKNGKPGTMEFRCIAKDGQVVPVEAHTTILVDDKGQPAGACGVLMDVTERKQSEETLARYALDLKRSNEELQQFAYVASHDLQEPLRMVASYLQLIESRYNDKLDEDGREFIAYAVGGATRMKALINDLLTYSRVQTQNRKFTTVDMEAVLSEVRGQLQIALEEANAQITHDPLPQVHGDQGLLVQLLQNLISNGIKYRRDESPQIHIRAERKKKTWVFAVKDNGIGIAEQYLERIFIIFQRLHSKEKYPGTGIGLAICKKVVERHGGDMWVESEVGKGTTFYFTLPVA